MRTDRPLTLGALLLATWSDGVGLGFLAVIMVPAWICLVGLPLSGLAAIGLMSALLQGGGSETAAFTGELLIGDGAAVTATRTGIDVGGSVWIVGREARVQVPPGVHSTPSPLELPSSALAQGAMVTVVGTFRAIAQPGLRAASLDWPSGAWLLLGDYLSARATLARRATRWTIALLLPILLLATVTSGALMLDLSTRAWATAGW